MQLSGWFSRSLPHLYTLKSRRFWPLQALRQPAWPPSPAIAPLLSPLELVEEEKTPYYRPDRFYPAFLGEILNDRYQIASKLGYGAGSTVWLARDLHNYRWSKDRYVAIKINASEHGTRKSAAEGELNILQRISETSTAHKGRHFVRKLDGSFTLDGAAGKHLCFVFEALREPLWIYRRRWVGDTIPVEILKLNLQMNSEDLKPDNIIIRLEDPTVLEGVAKDEYEQPLSQKRADGRIIYLSRNDFGPLRRPTGTIQITDFDHSVSGDETRYGCIQNEVYRAPEVILDSGHSYAADIWSLGVMLWDVLERKHLFEKSTSKDADEYDGEAHLAFITALLGPPPMELLTSGRRTPLYYHADGSPKNPRPLPKDFSFESTLQTTLGKEKQMLIGFVKRMVTWRPEDRGTAKELLDDPWLHEDFN